MRLSGERGQAGIVLVAVLLAVLVGAFVLGGIARGIGQQAGQQRAADLAALAGAKAMHTAYPRLFEGERGITVAAYRALAERTARDVAERNGADATAVAFPDADAFAPVRIRVTVAREGEVRDRRVTLRAIADAELAPPATLGADLRGEYTGPLAHRQGKPTRTIGHAPVLRK